MRRRRQLSAACLVVAGATLAFARAWACVPQPLVWIQPRSSSAAGAQVTVSGLAFSQGPVEIRWNAVDGPLLASVSGPTFSVPITVPTTDGGTYALIAFSRDQGGGVGVSTRAAFTVTGTDSGPAPSPATTVGADRAVGRSTAHASEDISPGVAVVSGLALAIVGGLLGGLVSRRSRRDHSSPVLQRR